jgi:hypothetical protein
MGGAAPGCEYLGNGTSVLPLATVAQLTALASSVIGRPRMLPAVRRRAAPLDTGRRFDPPVGPAVPCGGLTAAVVSCPGRMGDGLPSVSRIGQYSGPNLARPPGSVSVEFSGEQADLSAE